MKKYKFIGALVAFLILAGISCWATEKSLHMLLPAGWPEILVWGITIAFFVIAAIGTKLIVDSVLAQEYVHYRRGKLLGGIILVVFFWLLMSMPTNTHTFFYDDTIGTTISKDIETTNRYLHQIVDKMASSTSVLDEEGKRMKDAVEEQWRHIVAQFNGEEPPYQKGDGKEVGEHLGRINDILNSSIRQQTSRRNSQDPAILEGYQAEIDEALSYALRSHTITLETAAGALKAETELSVYKDSIRNHIANKKLTSNEIHKCESLLDAGYDIVAANKNFVQFAKGTDDEEVYTQNREKHQTRTKRMSSVNDVFFDDFIHGKFPKSFWYYILISVLVDIAAFIFFDIAFTKKID